MLKGQKLSGPFIIKIERSKMKNLIILITIQILLLSSCSEIDSNKLDNNSQINLTDAKIKLYKNKVAKDQKNYLYKNNLAKNYIQKARETGDSNFYIKANEILQNSLSMNPDNYATNVLIGKVSISLHNFRNSIKYSKKAISLKPDKSYAYGILGDAYLELGKIAKAEKSYNKMHAIFPNLDSFSRLSNLNVVRGNIDQAITLMQKGYNSALNENRPVENLAWAQVMIGANYFDSGNLDKAESHYKKALEILNNYYLALEHLEEIDIIKKNNAENL